MTKIHTFSLMQAQMSILLGNIGGLFKVSSNFRCDYCGKGAEVYENLEKYKQVNKDFQIRCNGLTCETGTHVRCHYGDAGEVLDIVEDSLKVIVMKKCMEGIKFNFKVRLKFIFKFMFKLKDFSKFLCDSC